MDQTQLYIIKQSCLDRATTLHSKSDNWDEEKLIRTAEVFGDWVCGEQSGKVNLLPPLPVIPDAEKQWLNFNTPDYNKAIDWIKEGYTVKDIRNQYKVAKKVEHELQKV